MAEKRYAKEQENGSLIVGTGTDVEFYKSIGMELMSVEKGWDGAYYKEGQVPAKPEPTIEEQVSSLEQAYGMTRWQREGILAEGSLYSEHTKAKAQEIEDLAKELREVSK